MPTLQFKGKTAVETYHHTVPHHTFEFDVKLSELPRSEKPSLDGNLIIEGDNLLALKALLPTHAGRIKCIYIDPPYNTGNEGWIYNDNLTQPQFKEWIGQVVGKEEEDACRHDKWCCMMYPRLQLLKQLLDPETGVIMVSIDDNEVHHLKMLLDEVFGPTNLAGTLVWEKGRKNDAKFISVGHEYILTYAASIEGLKRKGVWREAKPGAREIQQEYERLRKKFGDDNASVQKGLREFYKNLPKGHPSKQHSRYGNVDDHGVWRDDNMSWPGGGGPTYDVRHPKTGKPCKVPDGGWRYATIEKMNEMIAKGVVVFREDHTEPPIRKTYLVRSLSADLEENGEEDDIGIQVAGSYFYRSALQASNVLRQIFGKKVFDNPKDHEVLMRWIRYATFGEGDAIVLDSTAGSGTTAHAAVALNKEDGGSRKFIVVQQPYDTKENQVEKFNICQKITAERVRRVIKGYSYKTQSGKREKVVGTGGSFSYARLSAKPLFGEYRDFGENPPPYEEVAKYVFYTETSRQWNRADMDKKSGRIGEHNGTSYYLLYTPNQKADWAIDAEFLKSTAAKDANHRLVVYAEKIWLHRSALREWEAAHGKTVRTMIVPFNLR